MANKQWLAVFEDNSIHPTNTSSEIVHDLGVKVMSVRDHELEVTKLKQLLAQADHYLSMQYPEDEDEFETFRKELREVVNK